MLHAVAVKPFSSSSSFFVVVVFEDRLPIFIALLLFMFCTVAVTKGHGHTVVILLFYLLHMYI